LRLNLDFIQWPAMAVTVAAAWYVASSRKKPTAFGLLAPGNRGCYVQTKPPKRPSISSLCFLSLTLLAGGVHAASCTDACQKVISAESIADFRLE
jgi:hypothetical protein